MFSCSAEGADPWAGGAAELHPAAGQHGQPGRCAVLQCGDGGVCHPPSHRSLYLPESSQELLDDFKIFLMKVVGKLKRACKIDGELGSEPPPNKFPKSFFRLLATKNCLMMTMYYLPTT